MKNSEVTKRLKNISHDTRFYLASAEVKAINHAIKCVELMPEVLNELYKYRELIKDNCELYEDGHGYGRSFTELLAENEVPDAWYRIDAILKKAKELIE